MITIFCFAGRRGNLEIQLPYIRRILAEHPDVEYHVWNLARNDADRAYVKTIEGDRITVLEDLTRRSGAREGCRCMYCSSGLSQFDAVYQHYTQEQFKDRLFVKIDDDIVFIETARWPKFIDAVKDNPEHIISAMVINNGACTSTIPGFRHDFDGLSVLPREAYKSLAYAEMSHNFMFGHWRELLHQPVELIVPDNYLSINMIGYNWEMGRELADLLGTIPEPGAFDSVPEMPPEFMNMKCGDEGAANILPRYIFRGFLTAHLSFAPQYVPADREISLRKSYADIMHQYLEMENDMIFPRICSAVTHEEAMQLVELASGANVLELGAEYGYSTVLLAQVAELVCSVDTHQGDAHVGFTDTWDAFQSNLKEYGVVDKVHPLRGRFEDVLPQLAEQGIMFDGAFIDGAHDVGSVQRDLDLVVPLIHPGGWIAFHDYGRGPHNGFINFGVTEVADEFGVDGVVGCLAWGHVK